jgi:hypothetical protein
MRVKTSHFVAEIDGASVYLTSHLVHDDEALICRVFDAAGKLLVQFINPVGVGLECEMIPLEGAILEKYPATRYMTYKDNVALSANYTGGLEE